MPRSGDLNGLLASSDFYLYGPWSICRFIYLFIYLLGLVLYLQFRYLFAS